METVLSQLLSLLPKRDFRRCVEKYRGDHNVRTFSCWDQFVSLVIAQLARKESLREIEFCIRSMGKLLYHTGIRGKVSKSALADANERRPSAIFADFCHVLIGKTRKLYANDVFMKEVEGLVYVLDSSIIKLALSLCPWAFFGSRPPAGIKLHTQLDLKGSIPSFLYISKAKMSDNLFLDRIAIEAGALYIMDKAYFDLARLYKIHLKRGYFITRPKRHVKFKRIKSNKKQSESSIMSDQILRCAGKTGKRNFPERLRCVRFKDPETGKIFKFLTNNFDLSATLIAALYKARWEVETFFKWIKQNLRLDAFLGNSQNAIEIQIWTAVASYLSIAIARKQLRIQPSLTEIIRFLPQVLFLKVPLNKAFRNLPPEKSQKTEEQSHKQLDLF